MATRTERYEIPWFDQALMEQTQAEREIRTKGSCVSKQIPGDGARNKIQDRCENGEDKTRSQPPKTPSARPHAMRPDVSTGAHASPGGGGPSTS